MSRRVGTPKPAGVEARFRPGKFETVLHPDAKASGAAGEGGVIRSQTEGGRTPSFVALPDQPLTVAADLKSFEKPGVVKAEVIVGSLQGDEYGRGTVFENAGDKPVHHVVTVHLPQNLPESVRIGFDITNEKGETKREWSPHYDAKVLGSRAEAAALAEPDVLGEAVTQSVFGGNVLQQAVAGGLDQAAKVVPSSVASAAKLFGRLPSPLGGTVAQTLAGSASNVPTPTMSNADIARGIQGVIDTSPKDAAAWVRALGPIQTSWGHTLAQEFPASVGVFEGFSLEKHSNMVFGRFQSYWGDRALPLGVKPEHFAALCFLHDAGKPQAVRLQKKDRQSTFNVDVIERAAMEKQLPFSAPVSTLLAGLVSGDPIGGYLQSGKDVEGAAVMVETMAKRAGLGREQLLPFFGLLTVLYQCDATSYTVEAGGSSKSPINGVFDKHAPDADGRTYRFDESGRRLKFSERSEALFLRLANAVRARATQTSFPSGPVDLTRYRLTDAERDALPREYGSRYQNHLSVLGPKLDDDPAFAPISKAELVAVQQYSSEDFEEFNEMLRDDEAAPLGQKELRIKGVASALAQLPPFEGTVVRGARLGSATIAKYEPGQDITERAFTSTTVAADAEPLTMKADAQRGRVRFVIESRKLGKDISELSHFEREREVLFPPGTTFRVQSKAFDEVSGLTTIRMTERLPDDAE